MRLALLLLAARAIFAAVPVTALAFSPDARWLVSGDSGALNVWHAATGQLARRLTGLDGRVRAIAFSPNGQSLAVATGVPGQLGTLSLMDFENGGAMVLAAAKDEMLAAAFHPDGGVLAFGGTAGTIWIWSLAEHKVVATIEGHAGWINGLAFSPDGKLLASASGDQTTGIWDTKDWKSIFRLPLTPSDPVHAVAFSPEGDILAYASEEHAVRVWRTQNAFAEVDTTRPGRRNALMATRVVDTGACDPLSIAWIKGPQRSRMIAACSDGTLRAMPPGGNQQVTFSGHTDWVYAVAATSDGARIASGGGDGTVRIWGPGGRLLMTLGEEKRP